MKPKPAFSRLFFVLVSGLCLNSCVARSDGLGYALEGRWAGSIQSSDGLRLPTILSITQNDKGRLVAHIQSPGQSPQSFKAAELRFVGQALGLRFSKLDARASLVLSEGGALLSGSWKQGGKDSAIRLEKTAEDSVFSRAQEPRPPLSYESVEITFRNEEAGLDFQGTLSYPRVGKAKAGIVLVSGSGPQNRDEELAGHKPFLILADRLSQAGYAVLRYDDRGLHTSLENFNQSTCYDFLSDAESALAYFRNQDIVKVSRFGILGHSEGGIVAALAALKPGLLDFGVLLGCPAYAGDQLLLQQSGALMRAEGRPEISIQAAEKANRAIYQLILSKEPGKDLKASLEKTLLSYGVFGKAAKEQIEILSSPWYRAFLALDPYPALSAAEVPILALYGSKDLQVPAPENPERMTLALAAGGNSYSRVQSLDGLNHLFQSIYSQSSIGKSQLSGHPREYGGIDETMNEAVFEVLLPWLEGVEPQ